MKGGKYLILALFLLSSQQMRNQNYESKFILNTEEALRIEEESSPSAYMKNPVNVRYYSSNDWNGMIGSKNGYCKFDSVENGYRASYKLIKKYIEAYGLNSIKKIIGRYAPESENNTKDYINNVERWSGISKNSCISSEDINKISKLIAAMARQETGTIVKWENICKYASAKKW